MKTLYESILSSTRSGRVSLVRKWLDEHNIKNYTINDKGEIDVDGNVNLYKKSIKEFPEYIQFGVVTGSFNCNYCKLTTLRGCPRKVIGDFDCSNNRIVSLEGSPEYVGGFFDCMDNNLLISLDGAPRKVKSNFYCRSNNLTSLKGCPVEVGGDFDCCFNKLTSLEGAPKKIGGSFYCKNNTTKFTEDDVMKVCKVKLKKNIYV